MWLESGEVDNPAPGIDTVATVVHGMADVMQDGPAGRHIWVPGRWMPPRRGYVWVPHDWVREGHGWRMHEGHWRREHR
jgi:hypothetical protein